MVIIWSYAVSGRRKQEKDGLLFEKSIPQLASRGGHRARQEITAQLVGWSRYYYYLPHLPHPIRKSTLADFLVKTPNY